MRLETGKENILDLRSKPDTPPKASSQLSFDGLLDSCFKYKGVEVGRMYIVRPHLGNNGVEWIETCGEIIWKVRSDSFSYVGLEMYYDDSKKLAGFSDVVKILELPEYYKGTEVDRGIGQIMYQRSKDFLRFGFSALVDTLQEVDLEINWKHYFHEAGYHIVSTIRPKSTIGGRPRVEDVRD